MRTGSALLTLMLASGSLFCATHRVLLRPMDYPAALARLAAAHADIAGADWQAGTIEVIADDAGLKALQALGMPLHILETRDSAARSSALDPYTDPDEMAQFLFDQAALHPDLMEVVPLTDALYEGHVVYAAKITRGGGAKPAFLLDGGHHAREVMTGEIVKDAIEYLLANYDTDPRVTRWVDSIEIWVVPCANPDGTAYAFDHDPWWRKNRHPSCAVDLNRNYPFSWDRCRGSSGDCRDETYRGDSAASEPETRGILGLMAAVRPQFYLTYHSYGEYILWPYGCDYTAEDATFAEIGFALNAVLQDDTGRTGKYLAGTSFDALYTTDGTSDDEPYGTLGTFAYTIEVNSDRAGGFQPDFAQWRDVTVQRQRAAWQFFLDRTLDGPQVRGRVTDSAGSPVAGAALTVEGLAFDQGESPRTTGPDGRYFFIARAGQPVSITFTAPGYKPANFTTAVGTGPVELDVVLPLTHDRPASPPGSAGRDLVDSKSIQKGGDL